MDAEAVRSSAYFLLGAIWWRGYSRVGEVPRAKARPAEPAASQAARSSVDQPLVAEKVADSLVEVSVDEPLEVDAVAAEEPWYASHGAAAVTAVGVWFLPRLVKWVAALTCCRAAPRRAVVRHVQAGPTGRRRLGSRPGDRGAPQR